ncbi:MAG: class I SAM-dependent methyltransferase [Candidatus Methylomirabilis oxyfera]|nr:class I SAM-dependent methyltransferase [Candidatus Methylomirabilis oxyfera]
MTAHALVLRLVGRNKSVLEIGPASGYLSRRLVEAGSRVTGIEADAEAASRADHPGIHLICGSVEEEETLRKIQGGFDVVVLADVLEHLRWPEQTLLRMRAFLNPGGYAVVSLPNIANWKTRIGLLLGRFEYSDEGIMDRTHLRFFTKRSAEEMILKAGYEVLEFHPGATRMPRILLKTWPTLCAVHLVFKIAPREARA